MTPKYAKRMLHLKASEIREILKVTENPEIISFAGGLPAPELFPVTEIMEVSQKVLEESGSKALQYSTTEGYKPLREWIANRMNKKLFTSFDVDNILITHGSQQALDLTGKVFLDEGDVVVCESPTYLAAISAFKAYGCDFEEVKTDEQGMDMEDLEKILCNNQKVKIIYIIPDFQNPTGRTWNLEKRKTIAKLAEKYRVMIVEDNPYGELRFEGETFPSVKSFDRDGNVLCTGTFSKIFCPGFRIAWIAGDHEIIKKYVLVKQGVDLQCNTFAQMQIYKYLQTYDIDKHIFKITELYRQRRDLAIQIMEEVLPEGIFFTRPAGGLFIWIELPDYINAKEVLKKCIERKLAFVPGGAFFPNTQKENTLRINFSNMSEDRIKEGLTILGEVIKDFIN